MSFLYPAFLWALALGTIPIIIYYLMRFRALEVAWGATYVLERAMERLRKKLYLEQLILLALRVLVIVLLVIAFGRPFAESPEARVSGTGVHRVLVVDASYSMLAGDASDNAWQRAKDTMQELVATWGRGERWSLALVTDEVDWVVDDQPIESTEACHEILAGLEPQEAAASLAPALETILDRTGGRPTEVYLVADNQASTWENVREVSGRSRERSASGSPESGYRFYWVDPSPESHANLGVTEVRPSQQRVLPQHPARIFVRVRNFSQMPMTDVEVSFLVDGRHATKKQVSLLPGQDAWTHADVTFEEPGSHSVTARLPRDVLELDNTMSAGMEVSRSPAVRVVRDPSRGGKFDSAQGFLELFARVMADAEIRSASAAAADREAEKSPGSRIGLHILPPCDSDCSLQDLAEADIILADGGTRLTAKLTEHLKRYVEAGGCLLLGADDAVNPETWHRLLRPAGLLPAELETLHVERLGGETYRTISRTGFQTAALRAFETEDAGDITATKFYSWFRLGAIEDDAEVLASFGDGQPFAVASRRNPGVVILMAAGLNCRNNNLIVRETGYALVIRLLMTGYSGGIYPRTVQRKTPLRLELQETKPPDGVQFEVQGEQPVPLSIETVGSHQVAVLPQGAPRTGLGSVLVLEGNEHRRVWFGIQGERVDSDLTPVSQSVVKQLEQDWNLAVAKDWEELNAILAASRRGREWYSWAIVLALAVMAGEMAMQRRFV